jgi:hypothetical protein
MTGGTPAGDERDRLAQGLATLADQYVRLHGLLPRALGPIPGGRVRGGSPSREPMNITIFDTIIMVEAELLAMETEVRRAYGVGPAVVAGRPRREEGVVGPDPRVVAATGWLRRVIPTLDDDWVAYLAGLVHGTTEGPGLLAATRRLLGEAERAFRPETPCPMCGALSLVARRPSTGLIACANPACRDGEGRPHTWDATSWSPYAASLA